MPHFLQHSRTLASRWPVGQRLSGAWLLLALAISLGGLAVAGSEISESKRFPPVSQLPVHPGLPDPLVMFDGQRVTSKQQWFEKRRPELKALFQHYMYGDLPAAKALVESRVEHEDRQAFGGKA